MPSPESTAQQAAYKILDLLSAMDTETGELPPATMPLVMRELSEVGAVRLVTHPLTGEPQAIDISGLLHGMYFMMRDLIADISEARGADPLEVVANLRSRVDQG